MLSIESGESRFCDGVSRRDFLRVGSLGGSAALLPGLGSGLGLTLPQLLGLRSASASESGRSSTFGRAKRCIILYLWGGPPHQDTFDMKPDAPLEVRGEFGSIPTNVPGIAISDHLPLTAEQADKYTIIRSMTHSNGDHIAQCHDMLTGNMYAKTSPIVTARRTDNPHYGAVLAKLRPRNDSLPGYVQIPCLLRSNSGKVIPGQNGGFLGRKYDPFMLDAVPNKDSIQDPEFTSFSPSNLRLPGDLTRVRLNERRRLVDLIDDQLRRLDKSGVVEEFGGLYDRAFSIITSPEVRRAFDLSKADSDRRDRYGRHTFGQGVLTARRLTEAGVPLVTVYWRNGPPRTDIGWDNHINNFPNLKKWQLPPTDRAFSALVEDLAETGELDDTLVVLMGEFGRSPNVDKNGGRNHWPQVFSIVLAGGGIRGGEVYGASDSRAAEVQEAPVAPIDLGATVYHLLGIDPTTELRDALGRPHAVCKGSPVAGLI